MQNSVHNKAQSELTTHSAFGLKFRNNNLCLHTNSDYKQDHDVTVSMIKFIRRFLNKVDDLFDDFDWSNTIIAGGLISGMLETKSQQSEYASSDIDIFVYGSKKTVTSKIQSIYQYFIEKLDKKFYGFMFTPMSAILNIVIPDKFSIQIIGTRFNSEMEVLESFDFTHCQVGYNGNSVVNTKDFIKAITTKTTRLTGRSVHAYRLVKAYHRGYSIERPEYCYVKNIFHEYTEFQNKIPGQRPDISNTDKFYDINDLENIIHELEENPIVIQNLTKNYIPNSKSELSDDEEMKKIGELYAGKNKYTFVCSPNNNNDVFIDDVSHLIEFVRIPFPA
ncbi:hypothetical protein QLL95_gp0568 [Cotonvirus japonicus]|uniref:Uncharacterized protein n=1 Tax=Cotonvirus japonicus TaxID=2811091 RepID=A0ABM7NTR0_9VIRU|nr:hypothetical protein QLL95_gp0568 [Cotonvirus japonicus]BCS83555.1 hypothetical protein [Cotonvirus japonicus]